MRVLLGILLSLMIHFFFAWSSQYAPLFAQKLDAERVEIELIDESESQNETRTQPQIVRDSEAPEKERVEESEDPLTFLSGRTQRVRKQTQAENSGLTKNRTNDPFPDQTPTEPQPEEVERKETSKRDPRIAGDLDAFTPQYRKTPPPPRPRSREEDLERGLSTVGEALPNDITVGSFTALNTDRYLYYSFFSRIEEMIRFRWEAGVRSAIDNTLPERLTYNPSGVWITQMEVWLKSNGEVHSTHLMKGSGLKAFDQAAVQSFVQARLFPNPPEEMVESDGLIRLKYSFQVRYEPKVLVKSSE